MRESKKRQLRAEEILAKELYATRSNPDEWAEEPEDVAVRPSKMAVVSFRLPREELIMLNKAAKAAGESLSEFIRGAIALRFSGNSWIEPAVRVTFGARLGPERFTLHTSMEPSPWTENTLRLETSTLATFFAGTLLIQGSVFDTEFLAKHVPQVVEPKALLRESNSEAGR